MNNLTKVLKMVIILNKGGTIRRDFLAEALEVSQETVRKYAKHIKEAGLPIRSVTGLRGGYYFEKELNDDNVFKFDICKDCKR